jgi:uncharacterized membrane protein YeaQ/YmgE (transglycosylase-associated protein family)
MPQESQLDFWGAICFGVVIGWITYRTLRRNQSTGLTDIATVIGALGGAAITGIWKPGTGAFGGYCIGLLIGFFGYLIVSLLLVGKEGRRRVDEWLGRDPPTYRNPDTSSEVNRKPPPG